MYILGFCEFLLVGKYGVFRGQRGNHASSRFSDNKQIVTTYKKQMDIRFRDSEAKNSILFYVLNSVFTTAIALSQAHQARLIDILIIVTSLKL